MTMPNFLIIGAMKAGTTSLYAYLKQHPQIYMSPVKEARFFALEEKGLPSSPTEAQTKLWAGSVTQLADYQALFQNVTTEKAIGEVSPLYLAWSEKSARRIKHHIPQAKLIAILRHPVDRAYSHFAHNVKMGLEPLTNFVEALQADDIQMRWWYKKQGFYYQLLKPYFELFDHSQLKILLYNDLQNNSLDLLQDIFKFLEVDETFLPDMSTRHMSSPQKLVAARATQLPLELRQQLVEEYRADIEQLQQLTQLDLSQWLGSKTEQPAPVQDQSTPSPKNVRPIAFYLPQYHPTPENNTWWGQGFTEWTNVAKANPLFLGHYQPHLPADLGFYDLRLPEVRQAQADLAGEYGIYGFCYYHYWFNGRRLLNRPLDEVLESGRPDFPFCLCWANENWTRAWDGHEQDILIRQDYSFDDDRQHLRWLADVFRDERYIRVNGKPLFLVYRISKLPNPQQTAAIWREEAHKLGVGDLYLCTIESLRDDRIDPTRLGFDAAVEFQPDWLSLPPLLRRFGQSNTIYDYGAVAAKMSQKTVPSYTRFPCVTPGWDNTSRRRQDAVILTNSTPPKYQRWLENTIQKFTPGTPDENLVFINAWNEWGEGAHLEPCQKWGRAYLEATRQALFPRQTPVELASAHTQPQPLPNRSPRISVCIPTYNGAKYLGEAIESILNQTCLDFELIVIDDNSSDGTETVVRSFNDERISFIQNPSRLGLVGNWNKCLEAATGPYICVFHQDDVMMPDNLAKKIKVLDENPTVGMVHSNVWQIAENGFVLSKWWYFEPDPTQPIVKPGYAAFDELFTGVNIVCCPSVVLRRESYKQLGGFDAQLPFTADWEMWLRIGLFYDVAYLPEGLIKYRRHEAMETLNFSEVKALDHACQAKMRILEKYPEHIPDVENLKLQVAQDYQQQAVKQTIHHYQTQHYELAKQYLAFVIKIDEHISGNGSNSEHVNWPLSPLELSFEAQQELLNSLSAEDIARRIGIRRMIQAIAFKVGNQPGLGWLYRFRDLGKRVLGGK